MTNQQPDQRDLTDYFYENLEPENRYPFLDQLLTEQPGAKVPFIDMLLDTDEFENDCYELIQDFADRYRKIYPKKYRGKYEFIEAKLTDHAFDKRDESLIDRCLEIIRQNPVNGIDVVTEKTLYQLVYHGYHDRALAYSRDVWKPISESKDLVGYPELPFIMTIYLHGLEKQYEKISAGDTSGWESFLEEIIELGFENEPKRVSRMLHSLRSDLDPAKLIDDLREDPEYGFIELIYHFMRYMKSRYDMPFSLSERIANLIHFKGLFGRHSQPSAFFYITHRDLDKHIIYKLDTFMGINQIEVFGKAWGLHYFYEFVYENGLMDDAHYTLMLENLAFLKKEFLAAVGPEVWKMKFVKSWPESQADLLHLPDRFFDRIDRKDTLKAIRETRETLPETPGEKRIEEELEQAKRLKNPEPGAGSAEQGWEIPESDFSFDPYIQETKTGRNDPCPCGSGKKFKKCCL